MSSSSSTSYLCHRCRRFIRVQSIVCPDCDGEFLEEVARPSPRSDGNERRWTHSPEMYLPGRSGSNSAAMSPTREAPRDSAIRRRNRIGRERSSFNPVIVFRGRSETSQRGAISAAERDGGFDLFYYAGSGLRPVPTVISNSLMSSGFHRLLDQLARIEANGIGRCEHLPASKSAVESMSTIKIVESHIYKDSHCAVCKEPFDFNTDAKEMPCKHIYHSDCILPWLSMRNNCPVCRHELPADTHPQVRAAAGSADGADEESTVGLTIWRLPGGSFAVGRFSGLGRIEEQELPTVYTEMDGDFNSGAAASRIPWVTARRSTTRPRSGIGRAIGSLFTFFGRFLGSPSSPSRPRNLESSRRGRLFSSRRSRHRPTWAFELRDSVRRC